MIRTHRRGGLEPSESFYEDGGVRMLNEEETSQDRIPSKKFVGSSSYATGYVDPAARMRYSVVEVRAGGGKGAMATDDVR